MCASVSVIFFLRLLCFCDWLHVYLRDGSVYGQRARAYMSDARACVKNEPRKAVAEVSKKKRTNKLWNSIGSNVRSFQFQLSRIPIRLRN